MEDWIPKGRNERKLIVELRWQVRSEAEMISIDHRHTPLMRRQQYWRHLLTSRETAAEIRLLGLQDHFLKQWRGLTDGRLDELRSARRGNMVAGVAIHSANRVLQATLSLGLLLVGARGELSVGTFVALIYSVHTYLDNLFMVSWRIESLQRFASELVYVPQLLELEGDERVGGAALPVSITEGIDFGRVCFAYPYTEEDVLHSIDLRIRPGERIALIGENGAGKTTLAKLLMGLYRPTAGTVRVDGVDLGQIDPVAWRQRVVAVFRDHQRYALSARENMVFGQVEEIDDERAMAVAIIVPLCASGTYLTHLSTSHTGRANNPLAVFHLAQP